MVETGIERRIELPYAPRTQFLSFHHRKERFAALVCHRRAGKTVATLNDTIARALSCPRPDGRYAYIAPLLKQAKAVAWDYLRHYTKVIPDVRTHETELRIDLPNGSRIRLYGADNPDALRGQYFDGAVLDEYAQMNSRLWPEIIRPALADRLGWATFIGTPMGRNPFCDLVESAKLSPEWFSMILRASESGLLPEEELEAARSAMTEDQYNQEFECSFDAAIVGSYYGKLLNDLEAKSQIGNVPYDPKLKVDTAWDLGIGDSTVIWFCQRLGQEIRLIDYYEASGESLHHYVKVLRDKPYIYGRHYLPHDAEARELGTGKTRQEVLRDLGVNTDILPRLEIDDRINNVMMTLPRCWFDAAKCGPGIEALKQYRREYNDKMKTFHSRPVHDWASHAADAFGYLCQGLRDVGTDVMKKKLVYPQQKLKFRAIV